MLKFQNFLEREAGLRNLVAELDCLNRSCELMHFSRAIFYRAQKAIHVGDVEALTDAVRKEPNRRNRAANCCCQGKHYPHLPRRLITGIEQNSNGIINRLELPFISSHAEQANRCRYRVRCLSSFSKRPHAATRSARH